MIPIVMATDDNYTQHLAVAMASCLNNCDSDETVRFYILANGVADEQKRRLETVANTIGHGGEVVFIDIADKQIAGFIKQTHVSQSTYSRYYIPSLIPQNIDKIIYMDTDVVVKADISKLYNIDLGDYYLGATKDLLNYHEKLSVPKQYDLLNAGVLLINLKKWRENDLQEKLLKSSLENQFDDQEVLNALLYGKWLQLDPRWNLQTGLYRIYYQYTYRKGKFFLDLAELKKDPYIIHYAGGSKVWSYGYKYIFADEYYKYLKMTPWKDYKPTDITFRNAFDRYRYIVRKFIISHIRRE